MNKETFKFILSKKWFRTIFMPILVVSCSLLAMFFSYAHGYKSADVSFYSALMSADKETKKQGNDLNFCHGTLIYGDSISSKDQYDSSIAFQHKTIYKHAYYNSYVVSSYKNETILYDVDTGLNNETNWNKASIVMVRNFYDGSYMESLGLPLFDPDGKAENHNHIRTKSANASLGSYISASSAYEIVSNNGMLSKNHDDVVSAFKELLNDKEYAYKLSSSNKNFDGNLTFSVNDIYIDSGFEYLLNDNQKSISDISYGNYYKTFCYWNKNAILTYSPDLMETGSTLKFDIRKNYKNFDLYFGGVLGYDYALDGKRISFESSNKILVEESELMNKTSIEYSKKDIGYLVAAIVVFEALLLIHSYFISFFTKEKINKKNIWFYLLPAIPFVLIQLFTYFYLLFTGNVLFIDRVFNHAGNMVVFIFSLIIVANGFIWRKMDSDEKN